MASFGDKREKVAANLSRLSNYRFSIQRLHQVGQNKKKILGVDDSNLSKSSPSAREEEVGTKLFITIY